MSLTDIPAISPSTVGIFLIALPIILFIFFFTQPKQSDSEQLK